MDQTTIKRNEDNDLKYRQGLYNLDPNSWPLKDPVKANKDGSSIYEGQNAANEKLEYFTE